MNAISSQLVAKVLSGQRRSQNPKTWAALILAGIVANDFSDPDVQDALAQVQLIALSSENPEVWVAMFLADIAVTGLSGLPAGGVTGDVLTIDANGRRVWGAGTPGPPGASELTVLELVTGYTGGGPTNLDGVATVAVTVPALFYFTHSDGSGRFYWLRAGTDAEASPGIVRPDDYNAGTNAKVFVSTL